MTLQAFLSAWRRINGRHYIVLHGRSVIAHMAESQSMMHTQPTKPGLMTWIIPVPKSSASARPNPSQPENTEGLRIKV